MEGSNLGVSGFERGVATALGCGAVVGTHPLEPAPSPRPSCRCGSALWAPRVGAPPPPNAPLGGLRQGHPTVADEFGWEGWPMQIAVDSHLSRIGVAWRALSANGRNGASAERSGVGLVGGDSISAASSAERFERLALMRSRCYIRRLRADLARPTHLRPLFAPARGEPRTGGLRRWGQRGGWTLRFELSLDLLRTALVAVSRENSAPSNLAASIQVHVPSARIWPFDAGLQEGLARRQLRLR